MLLETRITNASTGHSNRYALFAPVMQVVMQKIMIKLIKWIIGIVFVGLIGVWGFGVYLFDSQGTDVAFQSSDGNWADNEVLFKGRNFESMVFYFELYKIRCDIDNVSLQRLTKKPNIFTASRWFDDYGQKKWKVPLATHHPKLNGAHYYPKVTMDHCYNGGSTKEELALARKKASQHLSSL